MNKYRYTLDPHLRDDGGRIQSRRRVQVTVDAEDLTEALNAIKETLNVGLFCLGRGAIETKVEGKWKPEEES